MPYAQWHYPFENVEEFERSFPADYICEAIDQTRGWFYSLHAEAALLKSSEAVPENISYRNVICLGPDEWMLRDLAGAEIPLGADLPVAITDVSDRAICIIIDGPRAAQILMAGCPLDLDNFAVGRATRTIYETVEIILIRTAHDNFHIEVWRSFAPWLWTALTTASGH